MPPRSALHLSGRRRGLGLLDLALMQHSTTVRALSLLGIIGLALLALPSAHATSDAVERASTGWVIPNGKESIIRRALEPPKSRAWLRLQSAQVDRDRVLVRFGPSREGETTFSVTLVHPSVAEETQLGTEHMGIAREPGPALDSDLATLKSRLEAAGAALQVWQFIAPEPEEVQPPAEKPEAERAAEAAEVVDVMAKVRQAYARGNNDEVAQLLKSLDAAKIADGGVRLEMAIMHAKLGDEQATRNISRTFPEDPELGEQALFGPALRVELPPAATLFEGKDPEAICLLHRIGDILARIGRTGPAGELFEAIMQRAPTCTRAAERWGLMLLDQRQGDRAIEVLERHQKNNPSDIRLTLALSHAYRMTGELEEAIRLFHTTAETLAFDENNQYLGQLLALYLTSSTVEQWVDHWREVLEWKPDHVTGRFLLGACLHYLDAFEESNLHLEKLVGVIDHEPRLYVYQAMNHFNLGDTAKARAFLEEGIALKKVDPDVYYCRAEITRDTERDLALSDLERYLVLTARSQYENPGKRKRVVQMRDALKTCKAEGIAVCAGPWEHPRSRVLGFIRRNEVQLIVFGVLLALSAVGVAMRRRRAHS